MKICIPTTGNSGLSETVYNHFGSSQYFTIYDTNSKSIQIIENTNKHHSHGACYPLGVISKYNVDAILTNGMGKRAVQLLNESGIKVFLVNVKTVEDAVKKFESNELVELTPETACGGHGCH